MTIRARPDFDWSLVQWGGPDEPQSDECSVCDAAIPEDACPLQLWNNEGWAAVFCDACAADIFGMKFFPSEPRP